MLFGSTEILCLQKSELIDQKGKLRHLAKFVITTSQKLNKHED